MGCRTDHFTSTASVSRGSISLHPTNTLCLSLCVSSSSSTDLNAQQGAAVQTHAVKDFSDSGRAEGQTQSRSEPRDDSEEMEHGMKATGEKFCFPSSLYSEASRLFPRKHQTVGLVLQLLQRTLTKTHIWHSNSQKAYRLKSYCGLSNNIYEPYN